MKVLSTFQIEVFDREEADNLDSLGIYNAQDKVEIRVVNLRLDLIDVETFRKTYTSDQKERECVNIQTKSGESYLLLISEDEFLKKYIERFGEGNIKIQ